MQYAVASASMKIFLWEPRPKDAAFPSSVGHMLHYAIVLCFRGASVLHDGDLFMVQYTTVHYNTAKVQNTSTVQYGLVH